MKGKPVPLNRLCPDIRQSLMSSARFRAERREAVRDFCGPHYSDDGPRTPRPVNLLGLYVSIVGRSLIANNPRVLLSTFIRSMRPTVNSMATWVNDTIKEMQFAVTERRVVLDAMFSMGIGKVGLATPSDAANYSWKLKAGHPFYSTVDPDDFVWDRRANDFSECQWMANRYRCPLDTVRDSNLYSKRRKDLTASRDAAYDSTGEERTKRIAQGYWGDGDEFEDMVDLWEVYLPRHGLILTLEDDFICGPQTYGSYDDEDQALRVQKWLGPACGPYHILNYIDVPGNILPKGPIQDLREIDSNANNAFDKAFRTIAQSREVNIFDKADDADAENLRTAPHLSWLGLTNPKAVQTITLGGATMQPLMGAAEMLKQLFDFMAGNLSIQGGLGPQSKTLGQDRMLNENSSQGIVEMQERTLAHTTSTIEALCWYWYNHPELHMDAEITIPGLPGISTVDTVSPQRRQQVPFEKLRIHVDPYSLQYKTPQARLKGIIEFIQGVYLPMAQLAAQSGNVLDLNALFKKASELMDEPDLKDLLNVQEPPDPEDAQGGSGESHQDDGLTAPDSTEHIRRNVAQDGPSDGERAMRLMGHNLGGKPSPSMNGQYA